MSKLAIYNEEARRLYVENGFSLEVIEKMLKGNVTRRTLFNWKVAGKWDEKRKKFLNSKSSIKEDILEIVKLAISEAKADPNSKNIRAVATAIGALDRLIDTSIDPGDDEKDDKQQGASQETVKLVRDLLGIGK